MDQTDRFITQFVCKLKKKSKEERKNPSSSRRRCFIGFDGFTDHILSLVNQRRSREVYSTISTMDQFSSRIAQYSGKSGNIECITHQKKMGGNAPLFTSALTEADPNGLEVTLMGALGFPDIEPLFLPLVDRCQRVISLSPSAHTDAIEFSDGKILFGKHDSLQQITAEKVLASLAKEEWISLFSTLDLFATLNWSMVISTSQIWIHLLERIFLHFPFTDSVIVEKKRKKPWFFVDLADPRKRSEEEIREAFVLLEKWSLYFSIVLSLNWSEAEQIFFLYHTQSSSAYHACPTIREKSLYILDFLLEKFPFRQIVIHHASMISSGEEKSRFQIIPPPCAKPSLLTGAGDHFNAGYCNALLRNFSHKEASLWGMATAEKYIHTGVSPSLEEIHAFLLHEMR